ncbi:6228_t:CDS:2 [Entrophospora sp. SA101]|nr:6228_t:CDS:2 [Entrophospora sp. SA101]CAJ0843548.1 1916_t:CDS:2 [Entrophospora sp. SA101]
MDLTFSDKSASTQPVDNSNNIYTTITEMISLLEKSKKLSKRSTRLVSVFVEMIGSDGSVDVAGGCMTNGFAMMNP